jgi:hypothetical protein
MDEFSIKLFLQQSHSNLEAQSALEMPYFSNSNSSYGNHQAYMHILNTQAAQMRHQNLLDRYLHLASFHGGYAPPEARKAA